MKKLLILALFMTSCVDSGNRPTEPERILINDVNYKVYEIEGCEYIVMGYGDSKWGSHKGNCKNPLHITR
jgi:hypothetical protein